MTRKTLGVAGLSTLALALLTGCASIQDQIAKQVAQGVVNQATGGKVTVDQNGGNFTFKDKEGNVAQIGGGDQRPASVPADMPSLPNAKDYAWFGSKDGGLFTYVLDGTDYKGACTQMDALLKSSGWAESKNGFNMEIKGSKSTMYEKTGFTLSLTCASGESDSQTSITQTMGKSETPATQATSG